MFFGAAKRRREGAAFFPPVLPADVLRLNTGLGLGAALFRERVARERRILDGDLVLAEKLAAAGIDAFSGRRLTWLGDVTGRAEVLSPLRDINIYETVMQRHRGEYLKGIKHFAEGCAGAKYWRYAVITSGQRIPVGGDLKNLKETMTTRIAAWQRSIRERFDIEVLLNVVEFTFDKETRTLHLHFNVLYWPRVRVSPGNWIIFLKYTREFLGVVWKDCGRIERFEELIKYVMKTVDRNAFTIEEAAWLYKNLYRQRFIISYNSFAKHLAELRDARQKLAYVRQPGEAQKQLRIVQLPPLQPADRPEPDPNRIKRDAENVIVGRTGPMNRACAWSEPGTLIDGYTPEPVTEGGKKRLLDARERAAASRLWWDSAGAPDPATALAVSDAWLLAPDHESAELIVPLTQRTPAGAGGAFKVHTTELSLGRQCEVTRTSVRENQGQEQNRNDFLKQGIRGGLRRISSWEWYDPETGEIIANQND